MLDLWQGALFYTLKERNSQFTLDCLFILIAKSVWCPPDIGREVCSLKRGDSFIICGIKY